MSSLMPQVLTGDVVPGSVVQPVLGFPFTLSMPSRVQRSYVTNEPYGEPIKQEEKSSVPIPPRPTGDEKGQAGLMKILQSVMQKQGGAQQGPPRPPGGQQQQQQQAAGGAPIAQALPGDRMWRG